MRSEVVEYYTVGVGVGPFAAEGLDEAFGFAVGLRAVGSGVDVFDAELEAGGGEAFGFIAGAVVGHGAGDFDLVIGEEADGLAEGGDDAGDGFVFLDGGEAESGVVVDGDVEGLGAGAFIAIGAVAGGANTWFGEAS